MIHYVIGRCSWKTKQCKQAVVLKLQVAVLKLNQSPIHSSLHYQHLAACARSKDRAQVYDTLAETQAAAAAAAACLLTTGVYPDNAQ